MLQKSGFGSVMMGRNKKSSDNRRKDGVTIFGSFQQLVFDQFLFI